MTVRCVGIAPSEAPVSGPSEPRGAGVGPLEVAVRALPGAILRALRNTGVGRGGITNRCGALTADPSLAFKDP